MKLLFVSSPGLGHLQPMLGLALAARELGHQIAWATAPDMAPWLQAHGIHSLPAGAPFAQCRAEYRKRWPLAQQQAGRLRSLHAFQHLFGQLVADHMLPQLTSAIAGWRPDLVVNEAAALAAPLAARLSGLPHITHAFGLPMPVEILNAATLAMAPAWQAAGWVVPPFAGLYDHAAIEIAPPTLEAACPHPPQAAKVLRQQATSITGTAQDRLPAALEKAVNSADTRPWVYVTFGTLLDHSPAFEQLQAALTGLPARFIVTTSERQSLMPVTRTAPNIWRCGYVSQQLIFPHCQVVVSHAGSGTLFGALRHGLPQLCLPQGADQFRNADALVACGAGLLLEDDAATATGIQSAIATLLAEPRFGKQARLLAAETAAQPTPAAVMTQLVQRFTAPSLTR
jgi:UDP:flavonoid glycosyltransferase YjiC (YdhE family)